MTNVLTEIPSIPVVYENLAVGGAAVGFAKLPQTLVKTRYRFLNGPGLYTLDGTPPIAGAAPIGVPIYDGDSDTLDRNEATRFLAVRQGATNGMIRAIHYARA